MLAVGPLGPQYRWLFAWYELGIGAGFTSHLSTPLAGIGFSTCPSCAHLNVCPRLVPCRTKSRFGRDKCCRVCGGSGYRLYCPSRCWLFVISLFHCPVTFILFQVALLPLILDEEDKAAYWMDGQNKTNSFKLSDFFDTSLPSTVTQCTPHWYWQEWSLVVVKAALIDPGWFV